MSDPSDDDIDEDEDNCEEHYRQLPPRKFSNDIPTTTTCANPEPIEWNNKNDKSSYHHNDNSNIPLPVAVSHGINNSTRKNKKAP
mmetsp:Transcript_16807/g.36452  ORF Transcript_16807/g.36452 Transcript_16807/m.36452 type:complete len:85 (-) Transcript_16807:542-796(-)